VRANPETRTFAASPVWSTYGPPSNSMIHVGTELGNRGEVRGDDAIALSAAPPSWLTLLELSQRYGTARLLYCCCVKRLVDISLALFALVLLFPLLVIIAFVIRVDSRGPAIFRQTRIGRAGQPFVIYKFRTMMKQGSGLRLLEAPDGCLRHKIRDDPRVTRIGKLLRCTSLDELPQLINVVRGDMSLVGPRPELPEIVEGYQPWQHQRHLVRPGITGWWQIQGRSDRPMHEHTELDLYYVSNMSLSLDWQILRRTVRATIWGDGAF
jgi:lipopolysaccharide/colanic/teichoic acid biosynthesis glycosyltransferase